MKKNGRNNKETEETEETDQAENQASEEIKVKDKTRKFGSLEPLTAAQIVTLLIGSAGTSTTSHGGY